MEIKTLGNIEFKDIDVENRTLTHWISTIDVDYDRQVVLPKGINFDRYKDNPVVLNDHQMDAENIIGTCVDLCVSDYGVMAQTKFLERPENHVGQWLADTIFYLYQQKALRGWSIGFECIDAHRPDEKEKIMYESDELQGILDDIKLHEYSSVAIPNNPKCVIKNINCYSDELLKHIESGKPIELEVLKNEIKFIKKTYTYSDIKKSVDKAVKRKMKNMLIKSKKIIQY